MGISTIGMDNTGTTNKEEDLTLCVKLCPFQMICNPKIFKRFCFSIIVEKVRNGKTKIPPLHT